MKKTLSILSMVALGAGVALTGCGSSDDDNANVDDNGTGGKGIGGKDNGTGGKGTGGLGGLGGLGGGN